MLLEKMPQECFDWWR